MRHLIHGVGTYYIGRKNLQVRAGPCPHCLRTGRLLSYDTRKWFVFVLIPMIPLERLRIVDHCLICSRHLATPLEKWEAAKQSGISGALSKYQSASTAETAIEVHQQLLDFHQPEAAEAFRKKVREKFADDAKLYMCFGRALERLGQTEQADEYFQRAYELRPDSPEARLGRAGGLIRAGKLSEARALLDFLETPGAAKTYPVEPLYQLALAYQNANQHKAALELFAVMQREQPHLKNHVLFRDRVQESERSVATTDAPAPLSHLSGSSRGGNFGMLIKIGAAAIGVALLAVGISNEFIRRQRLLYIVNNYGQAVTLNISGHGSRTVQGIDKVSLAEGTYVARISTPVAEEIEFTIRDDYWHRWFGHPIWVLNLGGKAILQLTSAIYTRTNAPPPSLDFYYGQKFWHFPNVTHPFEALPRNIYYDRGASLTLTHLGVLTAAPTNLFTYYVEAGNIPAALGFAEWQLTRQPENLELLALYSQVGRTSDPKRLDNFIRHSATNQSR